MENNKKNKKKLIIILSSIAGVLVIAFTVFFVIKLIDGGKKLVKEVGKFSDKVENTPVINLENEIGEIVSNISETTTKKPEKESTEPETEAPTEAQTEILTEAPTEVPTEPPTEVVEEMPDYSGGVIVDVVITTTQPATKPESNKNTTEELLLMDELADENGNYHYENGICNVSSLKIELLPMKEQWIKENFGTSFTHNGVEFGWDEENGYYWVSKVGEIHYMTSTSTYRTEYNCRKVFSYRIADYLGFYGTDSARYHSEAALNDSMFLWGAETDFATVTDVYANNFKYLSELGWVEAVHPDDDISRSWTLESPEGIPAYMYEDGHLAIYVLYPGDEKEKLCYFTIEEYNELVQNNNWRISSYSFSSGFEFEPQEEWQKHIKKYVIIE